ncbi:MAG: methyl-accepting chemotaxis protein [Candidatus Hodarchaeales archaeon]
MDSNNKKVELSDLVSNCKRQIITLVGIGVLLSVLPGFLFSIIEYFLVYYQADKVVEEIIGYLMIFVSYIPVYAVFLGFFFFKMLNSLKTDLPVKNLLHWRKRFQILFFPIIILITTVYVFMWYILFDSLSDINLFIEALTSSVAFATIFGSMTLVSLEYLLDKVFSKPVSTILITEDRIVRFNSLTTSQKSIILEVFIFIGLLLYIFNRTYASLGVNITSILIVLFFFAAIPAIVHNLITNPRMEEVNSKLFESINSPSVSSEALPLNSLDEVGSLIQLYNKMNRNAEVMVSRSIQKSNKVIQTTEIMDSRTKEVNALSEEIASTIQQISQGATTQSELSNKALVEVDRVTKVIDESVDDINNILRVIEDIAQQTQILALNASIEAARAGESGRGFAVVADNVRRLADETRFNSAEIGTLTEDIVSKIGNSISELQDTLQNFAVQSEEFSASSEEVAAATEEQSAIMAELAQTAEELNNLVSIKGPRMGKK